MNKKIFISYKKTDSFGKLTRDFFIASNLCSILESNQIDCFFSEISLPATSSSEFKAQIDLALDSATDLIVVGTKTEYLESPWVKYEWDSFQQDIISGVKPNANIYCVIDNLKPENIPRGLRYKQRFLPTPEGFESLLAFLKGKNEEVAKKAGHTEKCFICKNCGKTFTASTMFGCSYHPSKPISFLTKNFDGTLIKKWYFPCCGKIIETNNGAVPPISPGCRSGFHER